MSLSQEEVDENSGADNLDEWDSLGHLSILSALDEKTDGKTSHIEEISELDSFNKLKSKLIAHKEINYGYAAILNFFSKIR